MRHLAQPGTLKHAGLAALATTLLCHPRLAIWVEPTHALWYLDASVFLTSLVLWSFVFAWHTCYTRQPVFTSKIERKPLLAATVTGLALACIHHFFMDDRLRAAMPTDYPANLLEWLAMLLFTLTMAHLFLLFAPFAWLMRLFRNPFIAASLVAVFGVLVLAMKTSALLPLPLLAVLLVGRAVLGVFSVWLYLRGGVLLVWWWTLLIEARHLPRLLAD